MMEGPAYCKIQRTWWVTSEELPILPLAYFVKFIFLLNDRMNVVHLEENWLLDNFSGLCFLIKLHGSAVLFVLLKIYFTVQEILKASVLLIICVY